jgi:transcription antitermination factor NusG
LIGEDDMNSGPKFKIMKIHDDNMMELMCRRDNREYTYLVHASEVRLAFKLYQEVKVVEGPHKGDVGVIICIK